MLLFKKKEKAYCSLKHYYSKKKVFLIKSTIVYLGRFEKLDQTCLITINIEYWYFKEE